MKNRSVNHISDHELRFIRHYYAGLERYFYLVDAAASLGEVTVNHHYLDNVEFGHFGLRQRNLVHETPFVEVEVAEPMHPKIPLDRKIDESPPAEISRREVAARLKAKLYEEWDPEAFHLICHSSGYDMRLVSLLLKQLAEEHGEAWLGDVLFLCWEPECELFEAVMRHEGWRENQYTCYQRGMGIDYRAESLRFDRVWKVNWYGLPWWVAGAAVEWATRKVDKPVHTYSGFCINTLAKINKRGFPAGNALDMLLEENYWHRDYSAVMGLLACDGVSFVYADVRIGPYIKDTFRDKIIATIDPKLASLKRYPDPDLRKDPLWLGQDRRLSKETRQRCADDFNDSIYAQIHGTVEIAPELPDEWWRSYVLASICQNLYERGTDIKW